VVRAWHVDSVPAQSDKKALTTEDTVEWRFTEDKTEFGGAATRRIVERPPHEDKPLGIVCGLFSRGGLSTMAGRLRRPPAELCLRRLHFPSVFLRSSVVLLFGR
jgi:hypothetical protein